MPDLLELLVKFEERFKIKNTEDYNRLTPIPSIFDQEISDLINAFLKGTMEEQEFARNAFSDEYSFTFLFFSERMACLSVREKLEKYLFEGLIAHAIEGGKFDPRENMLVLSLLYHSAVKIGADPVSLFKRASKFATGKIKEIIAGFPHRKLENRSIEAMGYIESSDKDGFRYTRTW